MSALYNMNDRGKQLCEALGTALATDKSYSIIFSFAIISHSLMKYESLFLERRLL